ncbi:MULTISPECIES: ATP synthase subunit I [unclassified Anabaena]|uniref:ATP synthase subunit I n=1 Tax=unclassified Anabaena TaxID=2619674 RepID=UPI000B0E81D8|nr:MULTISPECIES: ATP synthase subunit I [unclassified Anabaena]
MINYIFSLLISLILGFVLGVFYFASLWVTVRQLPTTQWPFRLIFGSFVGRIVIALLGFYLIMNGTWQRVLVALLGFLVARGVLIHRWVEKNDF